MTLTAIEVKNLKGLAKKLKVNPENIDFKAIMDPTLNYYENKRLLEEYILSLGGEKQLEIRKDEAEHYDKKMRELEEEQTKEEENKAIEQIKKVSNPKIDEFFYELGQYVQMVATGYCNALILKSSAGLGKSFQVTQGLARMGLKLGGNYEMLNTFSTPLEFYNFLYDHREKIIVLDDVEGLLDNPKGLALLKSALWSVTGKRIVHYLSTSEKVRVPRRFEFRGRIIFCLNAIPNNTIMKSLVNRAIYCPISFTYNEVIKIMYEICKQDYEGLTKEERFEVMDWIKENSSPATKDFNFRTLIKIFEIYRYNNQIWKKLAKRLLGEDKDLRRVWDLMRSGKKVKDQIKEYEETTGKGRRTYFRYKAKLNELVSGVT